MIVAKLRKLVTDPLMDTAISLVTPFAAYLLAEELHSSGVISVVVAGLLLGHKAPIIQTAQSRIAERINWRTIAFLLENTVFLLIGLQARWILEGVADSEISPGAHRRRLRRRAARHDRAAPGLGVRRALRCWSGPAPDPTTGQAPPWQYTFILGWAGMRGVVTLAAAFVIPRGRRAPRGAAAHRVHGRGRHPASSRGSRCPGSPAGSACPHPTRSRTRWPGRALLQQASKAGFMALDELEHDDPHGVYELIRQRVDQRNFAAWERLSTTDRPGVARATSTPAPGWS